MYATDRGTYVVQGWKVDVDEQSVEIPHRLLRHVETGSYLGSQMVDSGRGSFFMSGRAVTDQDVLAQMDIPGHETCVEVPSNEEVWFGGVATG
ncbi:hypothetical protein [Haloactinopolyspora alba]|uniref:hypothetical protein n=1 Tax=Haloactinopolyspora alba TaxID=648780 RepID=UPI00197AEB6C|nr:hypothetical protein [Haloactinopolyspora alba]